MCMKNIKSAAALLILTGTFLFTGEAAAQYRRDLASIPMQDEAQDGTVQSAEQSRVPHMDPARLHAVCCEPLARNASPAGRQR